MESVNEIKEALSARSRTATLDELRSEGRKRVRLIRAEHVAAMISEAVHTAVEQSGLVAAEDVEKLVEKSRQEFRGIVQERERELQKAQDNERLLAQRNQELASLQRRFEELTHSLTAARQELGELEALRSEAEGARAAAAVAHAEAEAARAETAAARGATSVAGAAASPSAAPSTDLLMSMMQEMANMKASLMHQQQQPVAAAAAPDLSAVLEKLTGSLNDRLEKLGKKMGVSAAVDSDTPVDFSGMFKDTGKDLESNMQNIEIKQKAGGGIAANLARLKKLKGGG